ncbi:serine/threonine-protein kinase [Nannocystis bainbridge]|uniref:Protein kinase n=1 Tax=Nannocystis bainbridge TaxID=2995303 RepID=A0ABT5E7V9_9BACT|nr:serine/threonine-protein kinase [Nannocystis bainbridge]MDC0721419.1 protein kinase [Nannocystis bainbridge]
MSRPLHEVDATLRGDEVPHETPRGELYANRYQIEALAGRGGMGAVYRAVDVLVGDVVALKLLGNSVTPKQLEGFRREVRLARRISHPNVARTHDMGEHRGVPFLIMEFVEGSTLQDLLHDPASAGGLAPARAARIALSVCEALTAAHAAGVVHRDLKPANVLLEVEGRVVLTDFGIARPLDDGQHTQGLLGTPVYMAPEQVAGAPVDARTDLYAVGLVLFEMLTGRLPFAGDTAFAAALARLTERPLELLSVRPDAPEALAELVRQCLSQESGHRPASAAAIAERLRGWLVGSGETISSGAGPLSTLASTRHPAGATTPTATLQAPMVAVLPLRYQGPPATAYLGEALTDAAIDVLQQTGGMRVLGSGATARYRDARDPRAVGTELGAAMVVDATLQVTPTLLRVQARLVEVQTGLQVYNERFEARAEDLLDAQEIVGKKIAEGLRVELTTYAHRRTGTPEAIALYRRARRKIIGGHVVGPDGAIELLEEALQAAPMFRPALASYAVACTRAWFFATRVGSPRDFAALSRAAVERTLELAPDLAESQFARGMYEVQVGEWRDAVKAFVRALDLAPTYAHAHEYLSQLQCEAGNIEDGVTRARLAAALEPSLLQAYAHVARVHALRRDLGALHEFLDKLEHQPHFQFQALITRVRVAGWFGDLDTVRACLERSRSMAQGERENAVSFSAHGLLGDYDRERLWVGLEDVIKNGPSPRMLTSTCQVTAEIMGLRGFQDDCLALIERACESRLIDLEWLDLCPALAAVRADPRFLKVRRTVAQRVEAMWIV